MHLRDLNLRVNYGLGDNLLTEFHIPESCAVRYDHTACLLHNSSALTGAAAGLARFIQDRPVRLLASYGNGDTRDIQTLQGRHQIPDCLAARPAASLVPENEVQVKRLSVLTWLLREGRIKAKIVIGPAEETLSPEVWYPARGQRGWRGVYWGRQGMSWIARE